MQLVLNAQTDFKHVFPEEQSTHIKHGKTEIRDPFQRQLIKSNVDLV